VACGAALTANAQQPSGIQLNNQGVSQIYPPFASEGWSLTRFSNQGAHMGDDYFAQDWARSCGQTRGQTVYAGISGTVVIANWQNGYGNTVVIYDSASKFALRYGHLDSIAVSSGQSVVAGETKIGFVGNTGSVSGSCNTDPGAHLHLALYKNAANQNSRPITSVRASGNATTYAVDFRYACPDTLVRTSGDPTVFVIQNGARRPVSWFVFNNRGWNFDRNRVLFDPVQLWSRSQINRYPLSHFATPRAGTLIKGDANQTVFLIERDQKRGISYNEFACRGFSFADVVTVPQGECDSYPSGNDLSGCGGGEAPHENNDELAKRDFEMLARNDWRFVSLITESFGRDLVVDPMWEIRWIDIAWTSNRRTSSYHLLSKQNRNIRYAGFIDPDTGQWTGWRQMQ